MEVVDSALEVMSDTVRNSIHSSSSHVKEIAVIRKNVVISTLIGWTDLLIDQVFLKERLHILLRELLGP